MDKPIEFRRRGRGYDRDDVNEFISRENIRFTKLEESYNKRIRDLENEVDALNKKISETDDDKSRIAELENELSQSDNRIESLNSTVSEKDAIIDGLKSALDTANENLEAANSLIDDLRSKPDQSQSPAGQLAQTALTVTYDETILEKAHKYDTICDNIDEIFAFAKEEADRIIAEALEMKKKVLRTSPAHVKNEITGRSDSIIEDLKRKLRKQPNKK